MNEEFAQWVYKRAFYIIGHPNDFTHFQYRCAWEVQDWYAEQYCTPDDTFPWYIPDGAIEVVCKAFDFGEESERQVSSFLDSSVNLDTVDDGDWFESGFGRDKTDVLADLQELRAAGECEIADDSDQEQDEYLSPRDYDHELDADLTYFEGAGVL